MTIGEIILSTLGLCVFEVVSSFDNAVVNADILATVTPRWRKWFFVWGIFFAVFVVRGLLPWAIVWMSHPAIGPWGALTASFSHDARIQHALAESSPLLLVGGGIFLIFLFFHWLFLEEKEFGLSMERYLTDQGVWFFAVVSLILTFVIWEALKVNPMMAFTASVGSSVFFITHGFKEHAAGAEKKMKSQSHLSDISKLVYLEILDTTFSIDGVIGAFAFTMSVPIIILGNGLGAIIVRELTIKGVDHIKNYKYLKNGAMYSIFFLGVIMLFDSFGMEVPYYIAPVITFVTIGYFFFKSLAAARGQSRNK